MLFGLFIKLWGFFFREEYGKGWRIKMEIRTFDLCVSNYYEWMIEIGWLILNVVLNFIVEGIIKSGIEEL